MSSIASRWEDRCARKAIVGMLSMHCAAVNQPKTPKKGHFGRWEIS